MQRLMKNQLYSGDAIRENWLVIMRLEDWIELYREWDSGVWLKEKGEGQEGG